LFERPHHQRIARVLEALDADLLLKNHCLFGGGTAIALAHGEYRESLDIDFICSSVDGYRDLRGAVHKGGIDALLKSPLPHLREPRIDQYGIRCALAIDDASVKLEVVFEGRIVLAKPGPRDHICGVWTLAMADRVATKLMANSDRWADDSVMSRDLIDLSMLTETGSLSREGVSKAKRAYGESVVSDFAKAKEHLLGREGRLRRCMDAMGMTMPLADMRARVERLRVGAVSKAKSPAAKPSR
jgi:hypothetical protein